MNPERWRAIEDVFGRAVELADTERAEFVARECGSDAELHAEVSSLLASMGGASESLQRAVASAAGRFAGEATEAWIGRKIGPYRIVAPLGEGGMGVVFRGERDDTEYKRDVAIKILHHGLGSPQAIARFRDERQILAALEHPGIVRLLDGGRTDDGLPYLVMERVEGVPISRYARALPVRDTLGLVLQVCAALQYAHGKLVVHRDIKPSNILVAADGTTKLLDFGIAKLIDPGAAQILEAHTRTGMALLTPEYASPEQVEGRRATAASDVYSLGVVLYELLAGQPPQRPTGGPLEMLRTICEVEPPRPSTVAAPDRRRDLAGDLDNIVLKALSKDPIHRYASIEQLADDLRRHLDGLPVTARTATFSYRAGKFVRRNRGKLAVAALVAMALSTATVVSIREARRADAAAERAQQRFDEVRKLANSLLFEIDESIRDVAGTTRARELVVTRALTYLDGLAREASTDPALARELAIAYMKIGDIQGSPYDPNIGKTADALVSYDKATALLDRLDPQDPQIASARLRARFGTGLVHHMNRDIPRARETLVAALANPTPVDPILRARAHLALAFDEKEANRVEASERHAEAGLALVATWDPSTSEARYWRAAFLIRRADAAARNGDPDAAVAALEEIVQLQAALAAEHANASKYRREHAYSLLLLAIATSGVGDSRIWVANTHDLARAEAAVRESAAIFERAASDDPHDADARMNVAALRTSVALVIAKRSPGDAMREFEHALAAFEAIPAALRDSTYGRENEYIAHCGAARSFAAAGRADAALEQAAIGKRLAGDAPFASAMCRYLVGLARRSLGDRAGAVRELAATAAALRPLATGTDTSALIGLVDTLSVLAELQPEKACELRAEALRVWTARNVGSKYFTRRARELERAACR